MTNATQGVVFGPRDRPAPPTKEMITAGARILNALAEGCLGPHHSAHVAEAVYRAMSDALSQPPSLGQKSGARVPKMRQQSV